jgi:hypothetical protein
LAVCFCVAVADAANAAASRIVVRNFIASIPPWNGKDQTAGVRCAALN